MLNVDPETYEWLRNERREIRKTMRQPGLTPQEREACEERLSSSRAHVGIAQALADNEVEMFLDETERVTRQEGRQRGWGWYVAVALLGLVIYKTLKWMVRG